MVRLQFWRSGEGGIWMILKQIYLNHGGIWTCTTTPDQSRPWINGNGELLHTPHNWGVTTRSSLQPYLRHVFWAVLTSQHISPPPHPDKMDIRLCKDIWQIKIYIVFHCFKYYEYVLLSAQSVGAIQYADSFSVVGQDHPPPNKCPG